MNNNYQALASKFECREKLLDLISKAKDTSWLVEGYGFDLLRVPVGFITDPFYAKICDKFLTKTWVLRSSAKTYFHWHKDQARKATINIDLLSEHSHTVFYGRHDKFQNIYDLDEAKYERDVPLLLNTNNVHMVLNTGGVAYKLSVGFPSTDFQTVRDFIISNNL